MFLCSCSHGFAPAKSLLCGSPDVIPLLLSSEVIGGHRQIDKCIICVGLVSKTVSVCREEQLSSGILEDKLQQLVRRLITICWMVIVLEGKSCGVTSFGDLARDHDLLKTPTICLVSLSLSLSLSLSPSFFNYKLPRGQTEMRLFLCAVRWKCEPIWANNSFMCIYKKKKRPHLCCFYWYCIIGDNLHLVKE